MATIIFHDLTPKAKIAPQDKDPKPHKDKQDKRGKKKSRLIYSPQFSKMLLEGWAFPIVAALLIVGYVVLLFSTKSNFRTKYDRCVFRGSDNYYKIEKDERWGIYDTIQGKEIIAPKYDDIDFFGSNRATRYELNKKFGFVNREGVEITPAKFEDARRFHNDRAAVCLNGLWGFINTRGEVVVELKYNEVKDFYINNHWVDKTKVRLGKEWFTIDKQGRRVEE